MPAPRDPSHYLRPLSTTKTPKRLLWLDCASLSRKEQGVWVDRWHCGALGSTHWASKSGKRIDKLTNHDDARALWVQAAAFCTPGRRVVLFAYDLAEQLRISQGLVWLPWFGWQLDKIVLERTAAWALFRKDKRTLMMCDLRSWAPVTLGQIASDVTGGDGNHVVAEAGPKYHAEQCRIRAAVVRDAVLQITNWIEGENLGVFRPTGSGQSYSAYRRRFMSHRLLVHDDTARLELERAAMWTGRCEAWRHGLLTGGPYVEYDMHAAYCHIAHECEIPTVANAALSSPSAARLEKFAEHGAVLAEVTITTDVPCVPTRYGGRTVWPVGTFRTVLWEPEWQLALHYASEFKCHRAWCYTRAPALRDFAGWVLDGLGEQTQVYGLVPRRVLKHWSRCLVGRLGLRYRAWEKFGTQPEPGLQLITYIDPEEGTSTDLLIAGTDRLILAEMSEAAESLPQIPGWVMSECRRRLWNTMVSVGLDNVIYCDTDSIIIDPKPTNWAQRLGQATTEMLWTMKGKYSRMTIHGPRNLVCETTRRVSGLPLTARQTAPLEFSGQIMRSIKESMRAGELDCVASIPRTFVLDAPDLRRQHLPDGRTIPLEVQLPSIEED